MNDVAGEPKVRTIIVGDVAARTNIARTNLLTATVRIYPKLIWRSEI
jgi:hypothetical protein